MRIKQSLCKVKIQECIMYMFTSTQNMHILIPLIDNMRDFGGVITGEDEEYRRHDIIEEAKGAGF